jgi:hypothetical protein
MSGCRKLRGSLGVSGRIRFGLQIYQKIPTMTPVRNRGDIPLGGRLETVHWNHIVEDNSDSGSMEVEVDIAVRLGAKM